MDKPTHRASGLLMHLSSLPGNTGIGTMGRHAYAFVDFLKRTRQTYWQILPLGPTSYGDSPYQSFSTFAGNPYFIDLDILAEEGFLSAADYADIDWGQDPTRVDYGLLYEKRHQLFSILQQNFRRAIPGDFEDFCRDNAFWLDDYALFMAIKDVHGGAPFSEWEDDIRTRQPQALDRWRRDCEGRVQYHQMLQYFFFRQWNALKRYANDNGIRIIGDLPIYVSADSADVWAQPRQFSLNDDGLPMEVAGCPPDAFSADGQLWGNPVYDWAYMSETDYDWWLRRLRMSLRTCDVVRIDHFRGFASYYCIPYGAETAREGVWRKGPGMDLFRRVKQELGEVPIIAEDLGFLTEEVYELLEESGFPGMKVLQFAFGPWSESQYLPHRHVKNSVVYTGTHDNNTLGGWVNTCVAEEVEHAMRYLRANGRDAVTEQMMIAAFASVADTCILTMQDILRLGAEARMNTPSTVGNNWQWRAAEGMITPQQEEFLKYNTELYRRVNRA